MTFDLDVVLRQGGFELRVQERVDARAVALVGPSGSGKTTLVEVVAGLRRPDRGTIAIDGRVLCSTAAGVHVAARDRRVGYVPQDVLLFPHLSVRRNVLYGARDGASADLDDVTELLELQPLMTRDVASLSGGERQRVALGRALMARPALLLLDEPLAAVDLPRRHRILQALLAIRDRLRLPMLYVAHAPEEIRVVADRVLALDAGRVIAAGPPADLLSADVMPRGSTTRMIGGRGLEP
ncbi:MAG: ATP-binding cassette domain-containing protein [Acidimicrobiia bacterium]|nr:ATP-binding cassette domain-containing protein [Acidimicrobiia bacterium]